MSRPPIDYEGCVLELRGGSIVVLDCETTY